MPTLDWLKQEFGYGYDSGNVLSIVPGRVRFAEERRSGGSYRRVYKKAIVPYLRSDSKVLELGPGRGSWSRAILSRIPQGELHTVDFQDVSQWLDPDRFGGRLICHTVHDNSFSGVPENYFDFFWSFGVLCHNDASAIAEILVHSRRAMKRGALSVHQFGDWNKLDRFGWVRGGVPETFKTQRDQDIWWPRNDQASMTKLATEAGWEVLRPDLDLLRRDAMVLLRNP